jgi:hypothetical protein
MSIGLSRKNLPYRENFTTKVADKTTVFKCSNIIHIFTHTFEKHFLNEI